MSFACKHEWMSVLEEGLKVYYIRTGEFEPFWMRTPKPLEYWCNESLCREYNIICTPHYSPQKTVAQVGQTIFESLSWNSTSPRNVSKLTKNGHGFLLVHTEQIYSVVLYFYWVVFTLHRLWFEVGHMLPEKSCFLLRMMLRWGWWFGAANRIVHLIKLSTCALCLVPAIWTFLQCLHYSLPEVFVFSGSCSCPHRWKYCTTHSAGHCSRRYSCGSPQKWSSPSDSANHYTPNYCPSARTHTKPTYHWHPVQHHPTTPSTHTGTTWFRVL